MPAFLRVRHVLREAGLVSLFPRGLLVTGAAHGAVCPERQEDLPLGKGLCASDPAEISAGTLRGWDQGPEATERQCVAHRSP